MLEIKWPDRQFVKKTKKENKLVKKIWLTNRTNTLSLSQGQKNTKTETQKHKAKKNEVRVDKERLSRFTWNDWDNTKRFKKKNSYPQAVAQSIHSNISSENVFVIIVFFNFRNGRLVNSNEIESFRMNTG